MPMIRHHRARVIALLMFLAPLICLPMTAIGDEMDEDEKEVAQAQQADDADTEQASVPTLLDIAEDADLPLGNDAEPESEPADERGPFEILDSTVPVNGFDTLYWLPDQSFPSIATPVPVLVAHGEQPGPVLCLTAAVHGDELNGVEMVRQLMFELDPERLAGTVVGVPIVNIEGFRSGSRYLSDRRDLNRYFPGNASGSSASRIAHSLFDNIVRRCDYLVDLHTGSQRRINLPQLRADLDDSRVLAFAQQFGGITVLHSPGVSGMLRDAAVKEDIIAVTMEAGGPNRLEQDAVRYGVQALETLMQNLNMRKARRFWSAPQPMFYESSWVRAEQGGILLSQVSLNDTVREGQVLGIVTDPVSNTGSAVLSPFNGRVLGMAEDQVVHAGYAVYRIGEERSARELEARASEPSSQAPTQQAAPEPDEEVDHEE